MTGSVFEAKSAVIHRLCQRYRQLPKRDQRAVLVLVIFSILVSAYYLILSPLSWAVDRAVEEYRTKLSEISWMQAHEAQARALGSQGATEAGGSLVAQISASAQNFRLTPQRIEPTDAGVTLLLENISFTNFVLWIDDLARNANVHVLRLTLTRQEKPGLVNVDTVVGR